MGVSEGVIFRFVLNVTGKGDKDWSQEKKT